MSRRGIITLVVRGGFGTIPNQHIRDTWTRAQQLLIPGTNRIDFSSYTPNIHGALQIQFAANDDGTGTINGYSAIIDDQQRVTFLTPHVSSDTVIYARYGDGTDWSNWFAILVERQFIEVIRIAYGLTDTLGSPIGTAQTLTLTGTLTGEFTTPPTTTTSPYWYFQVPSGFELDSIKNAGLAVPTPDPNWTQVGTTGRWINHSAFTGYTARFIIELRRA